MSHLDASPNFPRTSHVFVVAGDGKVLRPEVSGSAHCMVGRKYVPVSEAVNMKEYTSMTSEVRNMKQGERRYT